ncbi:hypothetical protein, partial [uncultured Ruegeria sp.]|uniref:hypothetical protein n=1 Tax=uncultured Ruegeria sp. TaxID=259304 RepID=UPI002628BD2B
ILPFDKGIESALHASIKEEFFNKIGSERTSDAFVKACSLSRHDKQRQCGLSYRSLDARQRLR